MKLGSPVAVELQTTVYERDVLEHWTREEVEAYRSGDPDAREAFDAAAVERALRGQGHGYDSDVRHE